MNSRDEIVFDGDPLPQDPNAPPRGVDYWGRECQCDCHTHANTVHVSACCHAKPETAR